MTFSNVIVDIICPRRPLVFSQSCCEVSTSLSDAGGLVVKATDLINSPCLLLGSFFSLTFVSN